MDAAKIEDGQVAADLMLRDPKTLPASATVDEVRGQLANPKVQMVLLAEHGKLLGAVTAIPDAARGGESALDYADTNPGTIGPSASGRAAFDQTAASPHRRTIVVDDDGTLLGLLCLNPSRTRLCGAPNSSTT